METAIAGMGPAGVNAAKTLRKNGFNGNITMFSAEKTPPYSPPALGDYLITGNDRVLFWEGRDFCDAYDINCRSGVAAAGIIPEKKILITENKEDIYFDHLVIASGSSLYAPVKGAWKKGVLNYKTLAGTQRIREIASRDGHKSAIVVGGGFIGVEIALCLAKSGIKVSLLNRRGWIMPRLLDRETAEYVRNDLESQGINVLLKTEASEFAGKDQVECLLTSDNRELKADIYIAATGVKPNIDFVRDSGIDCDRGVLVNSYLKTRYPFIYACGDVAETIDRISGKRTIHGLFPTAVHHGITAGYNILGRHIPYEQEISMNSLKKLSFKLIVAGCLNGDVIKYKTEEILRKIYIKDNKISGFVLLRDISNAGGLLSLLMKRADIRACRKQLL